MTSRPAAQHDLARRTHEFAEQVVRPVGGRIRPRQEFPWPVLEEAAVRGFYSPLFYRDLIGDPTGLSLPMFMEELFWGCAGIGLAVVMPALALSAIGQAASPEQMLQWAPECFGTPGDLKLAALAISEPEGGSDVRNLRTTARRDGSGPDADWIINGHKMWIGNGGIANVHVVNAVVDEELGHKGQALFVVPGGTPGLEWSASRQAGVPRLAHRRAGVQRRTRTRRPPARRTRQARPQTRQGTRIHRRPPAFRLGDARHVRETRPMVAAQALGIAGAALEYVTEYANRREAFGAPIIDHQGIAFPLADLATKIDAARPSTWRASWMAATGVPFERGEGSMSKLAASEVAVKTTERAIQTMGGWGYIKDHPVEKWYRDAKLYTIFEGTSEIQRIVISNALGAADGSRRCIRPRRTAARSTGVRPRHTSVMKGSPVRRFRPRISVLLPIMRLAMKVLRPPRK